MMSPLDENQTRLVTWPNVLTILRLAAVPVGLWFAWQAAPAGFLACFAFQLLTDHLDGYLARRLNQQSAVGAQLDTAADVAMWAGLSLAACWIWPDIVRRELGWLILATFACLVPLAVGFWKYGRLTSYHTWCSKACQVIVAGGSLLLLFKSSPWLFRAGIIFTTLSAIEMLVLISILPVWQANVPSLWHAQRLRKPRP